MSIDINVFKDSKEDFERYLKIQQELELQGRFSEDEEAPSYDGCDPITEDYPFISKGLGAKIRHAIYTNILRRYTKKINKELINLKVVGRENLRGVKGGIVTCNHISKLDSFAVRAAVGMNIKYVAADFNNWKGIMGKIGRNTGYIPLSMSLNKKLMRKFNEAIEYYLKKNKRILIYPEQSMWREYKKPRPCKNGAYRYAAKANKPIIPLFITLKEKEEKYDELNRMNFHDYTIHILPPIYPKPDISMKENAEYLRKENFRAWKDVYEKTYNTPLTYTTLDKSKIDI